MTQRFPIIPFHQFGAETEEDLLFLFAAPADTIARWAGVPRKGWRIRMLYQRWVTPGRANQVQTYWNDAAGYERDGRRFLLGPTALTLAATQPLDITDEGLALSYSPPFAPSDDEYKQLEISAQLALQQILPRLTEQEQEEVSAATPYIDAGVEDYNSNHILQSAIQISQIASDPEYFCQENDISAEERSELIEALESLCRPALVVDGQHRLLGASQSDHSVVLPVVLIPNASWLDQVYQFIVINETSQRVSSDLLTDIFGNSLSPNEQSEVRLRLAKSKIDVESRIAAVVAGSHPDSPFRSLVRLQLKAGSQRESGYVTEVTIRQLIDGGRGGTPGWRTDNEFYEHYIRPTVPDREEWDAWTSGKWQNYWFAFWSEVKDFYNEQSTGDPLWGSTQTNLTKAVTLRLLQELFIRKAIEKSRATDSLRSILINRFSPDEAEEIIAEEVKKNSLPEDVDEFRRIIREDFLSGGVPVRVFERPWVKSLDDDAGITELRNELLKAYDLTSSGQRYRAQNKAVFSVEDRD